MTSLRLVTITGGLLLATVSASPSSAQNAPGSPYFSPVLECLQNLMKEGVDHYGTEHGPMFSSVLDLTTRRLPDAPPPLLPGQRAVDRAYPGGNLQHDLHTLLLMPHVSRLTGDETFRKAANAYVDFFLRRCAAAGNGLFPCGEHAFWDFRQEKIAKPIHEDLGFVPLEFWEQAWRLNPAAVEKNIRALDRHFMEGDAWVWNRHAAINGDARPKEPAAFPRAGGFFIFQWTWLYTKTGDAPLIEFANRTSQRPQGIGHSVASMGISILRAIRLPGVPRDKALEERGREFTDRLIDPEDQPTKGLINLYRKYGSRSGEGTAGLDTYGFWDLVYQGSGGFGFLGAERIAMMALSTHRLTGSERHLQLAREILDFYRTLSIPQRDGITPGKFAGIIALALSLHELQRQPEDLEFARQVADVAMQTLFENGLVRAATGAAYYEAANGAGLLLTELTRLHLRITGNNYLLPPCENDI